MPSGGPPACSAPSSPARRTSRWSSSREITATLLSVIGGTLDGEAVLKGRSLFADRIGEEVSVPGFTLVDDPTDPDAYGAGRFDAEGLATRRNAADRRRACCARFLYNTYSARRAGTASTASAVRAGFKSAPGDRRPGPQGRAGHR